MSERFDAGNSECQVFVRRAGILAAVGHDLEISVGEYLIEVDRAASHVSARFGAHSLRVVDAIEGRRRCPGKLSAKDKAQIDAAIAERILQVDRYPTISFLSTGIDSQSDEHRVRGRVTLCGVVRETSFIALQRGAQLSAQLIVSQPDFAIVPYRAFGGALRVHADVAIEFRTRG